MAGDSLESALLDQRMRTEQHKANFETLKAQHLSLQEAHRGLRGEHETLVESYDKLYHKSQDIIGTLQSERDGKIVECEELRTQVLTADKLEQLRAQLSEEQEQPYRKRLDQVEGDYEAMRSEYNKLRCSYSFLKSEYEAAQATHQAVLLELKTKHEAEVDSYVKERRELLSRHKREGPSDISRIRQLSRENTELQQRVRALLSEIEELRAQSEHSGTRSKQGQVLQARQVAELQTVIKTMEIERSALSDQLQSLREELASSREELHSSSERLSQAQREASNTSRKLSDSEHRQQMALGELKIKHAQRCHDLERSLTECQAELQATCAQTESLQQALSKHEASIVEKERELEQRVQLAKGTEWEKQLELQREKIELEERVAEMQRTHSESITEAKLQMEQLEDKIRHLQTQKDSIESEAAVLRGQLQEQSDQHRTALQELDHLSTMKTKHHKLQADHRSLQRSEQELRSSLDKLKTSAQMLEGQLLRAQEDLLTLHHQQKETEERENQSRLSEREALEGRMEELQGQIRALSSQLHEAQTSSKQLQKRYRKQVHTLRQSVELSHGKEKQLALEKDNLKKSLTLENQRLRRKIADVQRRQKEFLFLLHSPLSPGLQSGLHALVQHGEQQHGEKEVPGVHRLDQLEMVHPSPPPTPHHHILHHSPTHSDHSLTQ